MTVIELLVSDGVNTTNCQFNLTVGDNAPPLLMCPSDQIETAENNCEFVVPDYLPQVIASDNCGTTTLSQTPAAGTIIFQGVTPITIIASDGINSDSCSFNLNVVEFIPPNAICQNINVILDPTGMASITATDIDGGSTDNCGNITTSIDINTFDCSNVGPNEVVLTVIDGSGNMSTCTAIVTIIDETPPTVICQDIIVILDDDDMASITADDVNVSSTDACGILDIEIDIDSFDCSNSGANIVTLSVTDVNGNIATCISIVTVEEIIETPVAVCQNITVTLGEDGTTTVNANDFDAGSTGARCIDGLGINIDSFSCADIGIPIEVELTVTSAAGTTDSCIAYVNVIDLIVPEITCPEDQTVTSEGPYPLPDYFATGQAVVSDNCLDLITVFNQNPAAGTLMPQGVHIITLSTQDISGFTAECEFTLTVIDNLGSQNTTALRTIKVYPNPANDVITLSNPQNINLRSVSIYDMTGRLIITKDLQAASQQSTIDISALQSGNYLLFIKSTYGQITKQLLKE